MKKHEQHVVFVIIRLTKINLLIADCVVFCLWLVTDRQPRSFRTRLFAEVHMSNMIWSMIHASPGLGRSHELHPRSQHPFEPPVLTAMFGWFNRDSLNYPEMPGMVTERTARFCSSRVSKQIEGCVKMGFTWFYIALTVLALKIFWNTRRDVYVRFGNEHSLGLWFLFCSKQEEEKPVEIKGFLQEALLKVAQCISGQIWTKWRELVTVSVWNSWGLVLREWDKWIYNNAIIMQYDLLET